jgi:hypothetical protein
MQQSVNSYSCESLEFTCFNSIKGDNNWENIIVVSFIKLVK